MEIPAYTISLGGRYKVSYNKFLLLIKISLFCWFAGARIQASFVSNYLIYQGLTITHLSTITAISLVFQVILGVICGVLADRIGRVKPFFFINAFIFLGALISIIFMPRLDECTKMITFDCIDGEIKAQCSCQNLQDNFHTESCAIIYGKKTMHYNENENCPFISILLKGGISFESKIRNETSHVCQYHVVFNNNSIENIPPCEVESCKTFKTICSCQDSFQCYKTRTFWIILYGILIVIYNTSGTNVCRFFDVIAMDLANQYNSDFGKLRIWSMLGLAVSHFLAELILQKTASDRRDKSYTPAFVCTTIFAILSFIPIWRISPKFHKPELMVWKKSFQFVMKLEIILFVIFLLITGISFSFLHLFGNWYFPELSSSDLFLDVSTAVFVLCGLPFLYISKWFFGKTGLRKFFVICLLSYALIFFARTLMQYSWFPIIAEMVNLFAYHLFWAAVIQYCDEVAPAELNATVKVLAGILHYNVARLGAITIGGYLMNNFGDRMAYGVIGSLALDYAMIYGTYLIIKRLHKKKPGLRLSSDENETISEKD